MADDILGTMAVLVKADTTQYRNALTAIKGKTHSVKIAVEADFNKLKEQMQAVEKLSTPAVVKVTADTTQFTRKLNEKIKEYSEKEVVIKASVDLSAIPKAVMLIDELAKAVTPTIHFKADTLGVETRVNELESQMSKRTISLNVSLSKESLLRMEEQIKDMVNRLAITSAGTPAGQPTGKPVRTKRATKSVKNIIEEGSYKETLRDLNVQQHKLGFPTVAKTPLEQMYPDTYRKFGQILGKVLNYGGLSPHGKPVAPLGKDVTMSWMQEFIPKMHPFQLNRSSIWDLAGAGKQLSVYETQPDRAFTANSDNSMHYGSKWIRGLTGRWDAAGHEFNHATIDKQIYPTVQSGQDALKRARILDAPIFDHSKQYSDPRTIAGEQLAIMYSSMAPFIMEKGRMPDIDEYIKTFRGLKNFGGSVRGGKQPTDTELTNLYGWYAMEMSYGGEQKEIDRFRANVDRVHGQLFPPPPMPPQPWDNRQKMLTTRMPFAALPASNQLALPPHVEPTPGAIPLYGSNQPLIPARAGAIQAGPSSIANRLALPADGYEMQRLAAIASSAGRYGGWEPGAAIGAGARYRKPSMPANTGLYDASGAAVSKSVLKDENFMADYEAGKYSGGWSDVMKWKAEQDMHARGGAVPSTNVISNPKMYGGGYGPAEAKAEADRADAIKRAQELQQKMMDGKKKLSIQQLQENLGIKASIGLIETAANRFDNMSKIMDRIPIRSLYRVRDVLQEMKWGAITSAFAISAPIVGGLLFMLKTAGDLDIKLKELGERGSYSGEQLEEFRNQALALGEATVFTARQVVEAQIELNKQGLESYEIMGAMPSVVNLAAAENIDLAESAYYVSTAMHAMNLDAEQAGRVVEMYGKAAGDSALSIYEAAHAMAFAGGAIKEAWGGKDGEKTVDAVAETLAAWEIAANQGAPKMYLGRYQRGLISTFQDMRDSSRLAAFDVEVQDDEGNLKSFTEIVRQFQNAKQTLDTQEMNMVWAQVPQEYASYLKYIVNAKKEMPGLSASERELYHAVEENGKIYLKGADLLEYYTNREKEAFKDGNMVAMIAASKMQSLNGAWENLKGTADSFFQTIAVRSGAIQVTTKLIQGMDKALEGLRAAIGGNWLTSTAFVGITALIATIPVLVLGMASLGLVLSNAGLAMKATTETAVELFQAFGIGVDLPLFSMKSLAVQLRGFAELMRVAIANNLELTATEIALAKSVDMTQKQYEELAAAKGLNLTMNEALMTSNSAVVGSEASRLAASGGALSAATRYLGQLNKLKSLANLKNVLGGTVILGFVMAIAELALFDSRFQGKIGKFIEMLAPLMAILEPAVSAAAWSFNNLLLILELVGNAFKFVVGGALTLAGLAGSMYEVFAGYQEFMKTGNATNWIKGVQDFDYWIKQLQQDVADLIDPVIRLINAFTMLFGMEAYQNPLNVSVPQVSPTTLTSGIDVNALPKFASGGVVTKPTFGIFGEAGAEAIIPLSQFKGEISFDSLNGVKILREMNLNTRNTSQNLLSLLTDGITATIGDATGGMGSSIGSALGALGGVPKTIKDFVVGTANGVWDYLVGAAKPITDFISNAAGGVWDFITDKTKGIADFITPAANGIWDFITTLPKSIWEFLTVTAPTAGSNLINSAGNFVNDVGKSSGFNGVVDSFFGSQPQQLGNVNVDTTPEITINPDIHVYLGDEELSEEIGKRIVEKVRWKRSMKI
jgi:TP901 family phage tail tape measure protein